MANKWTENQKKAIELTGKNILVSAAAGSGKTAVLVERIVSLISEPSADGTFYDIDKMVVVTFTKAAAAEMKERIRIELTKKLEANPSNTHLLRQVTLLNNALITTIDSFCLWIIRNHFLEINLDPGFKTADSGEISMIEDDICEELIEEYYSAGDEEFITLADFINDNKSDRRLKETILEVYNKSKSNPWPDEWLDKCTSVYTSDMDKLLNSELMKFYMGTIANKFNDYKKMYEELIAVCEGEGGPRPYLEAINDDYTFICSVHNRLQGICDSAAHSTVSTTTYNAVSATTDNAVGATTDNAVGMTIDNAVGATFDKIVDNMTNVSISDIFIHIVKQVGAYKPMTLSRKKSETPVDDDKKQYVKNKRDSFKKYIEAIKPTLASMVSADTLTNYDELGRMLDKLVDIVRKLAERVACEKHDRGVIDFNDMEHMALDVLVRKLDGGMEYTETADSLAKRFTHILIDEYQDSNALQEEIMLAISRHRLPEYKNNLYMVGDVKQSIYCFRQACPELFVRKYDSYIRHNERTSTADVADYDNVVIELSQNFRSRANVLNCANDVFKRVMTKEFSGIEYNEANQLNPSLEYPRNDEQPNFGMPDYSSTQLHIIGLDAEEEDTKQEYEAEYITGIINSLMGINDDEKSTCGNVSVNDMKNKSGNTSVNDMKSTCGNASVNDEKSTSDNASVNDMKSMHGYASSCDARKYVYDKSTGGLRPIEYRDIVILTRATKGWADTFANVLNDNGIPASCDVSEGYFNVREIRTVLNMLAIIDNPLQDIPLAAVMLSYFSTFTPEDLARIKIYARELGYADKNLYIQVQMLTKLSEAGNESRTKTCAESRTNDYDENKIECDNDSDNRVARDTLTLGETLRSSITDREKLDMLEGLDISQEERELSIKCQRFVTMLASWRQRAEYQGVYDILWSIIYDTGYYDYVGHMPTGRRRQANLDILLEKSQAYEKTSYRGLFNFLRYIEKLQKFDIDFTEGNASIGDDNAVRVMSIHKSKGLEFPVVILAGMSKKFNEQDSRSRMAIDQDYGIGVDYINLRKRTSRPTIIKEAIATHIKLQNIAEEQRILYVAMTRARERLYMTGVEKLTVDKNLERTARLVEANDKNLNAAGLDKTNLDTENAPRLAEANDKNLNAAGIDKTNLDTKNVPGLAEANMGNMGNFKLLINSEEKSGKLLTSKTYSYADNASLSTYWDMVLPVALLPAEANTGTFEVISDNRYINAATSHSTSNKADESTIPTSDTAEGSVASISNKAEGSVVHAMTDGDTMLAAKSNSEQSIQSKDTKRKVPELSEYQPPENANLKVKVTVSELKRMQHEADFEDNAYMESGLKKALEEDKAEAIEDTSEELVAPKQEDTSEELGAPKQEETIKELGAPKQEDSQEDTSRELRVLKQVDSQEDMSAELSMQKLIDSEDSTSEGRKANKDIEPILPKFITGEQNTLAANERGTAYHRIMECINLRIVHNEDDVKKEIARLLQEEKISDMQARCINPSDIYKFVTLSITDDIIAAEDNHNVYREQPFVFEYNNQLIQGVVDLYYINDNNTITILDYKTDRVSGIGGEAKLRERYAIQLDYYAKALEQITGRKVAKKLIYSFALGRCINV